MSVKLGVLSAVAFGGALGSVLRWLVDVLLPASPGQLPGGTLGVNVVGSALLGVAVVVLEDRASSSVQRGFIATGLLGGFTTFSTYVVQVAVLGEIAPRMALVYLVVTPALCVLAATLGAALTRRMRRTT